MTIDTRRINRLMYHDFFRFVLVGGTSTLIQFGLLIFFIEALGVPPVIASATAYTLSAVYNYAMNYTLTFKSTKRHVETVPKFILVAFVGVNVNTALFATFLHLIGIYLIAQCVAIGGTVLVNYLLHKHWIYRS